MLKVAYSGQNHRQSAFICRFNNLIITDRTAGLNDSRYTSLRRGNKSVGKGEKRIRGDNRAFGEGIGQSSLFRGLSGLQAAIRAESTRLICPAPIPAVAPSLAYTIAFDFTCLATRKAKSKSFSSCSVGSRSVTILRSSFVMMPVSESCTNKPPAIHFIKR